VTSVPHLAQRAWLNGDERAGRAASHQVSWELHRAGEILRQVAAALDRAPEVEAQIALDHRDFPLLPEPTRSTPSPGSRCDRLERGALAQRGAGRASTGDLADPEAKLATHAEAARTTALAAQVVDGLSGNL
jgi:hypothetical protein